jgi:pimeloyl-ACP methyl ester carboxylesterase
LDAYSQIAAKTGVVEGKEGTIRHFSMEKIPEVTPDVRIDAAGFPPYGSSTLPPAIRSRIVNNINGLAMHMLEAGFETKGRPCILLLHSFPELAHSWRKVMLPLAAAGYHVVAPDQRGYGRTTGWGRCVRGDLDSFRIPNLVRDALGLVRSSSDRT